MPENTHQQDDQARPRSTAKAQWWMATIPHESFTPFLPGGLKYIRGQLEMGETGYLHWQLVFATIDQCRLSSIRKILGSWHYEPTRSARALEYVFKDSTAVGGTRFELGNKPVKRSSPQAWEEIYEQAKSGKLEDIPKDVLIRCYSSLKSIRKDNLQPSMCNKQVFVYWGVTASGKSHLAWEEAGLTAYPKDPMTKFWDGYQSHKNVVIEEYRGAISISHILRWTDKYPVIIEAKHGACVLAAEKIWITSNIHPRDWYPDLDEATRDALLRRLSIRHFALAFRNQ